MTVSEVFAHEMARKDMEIRELRECLRAIAYDDKCEKHHDAMAREALLYRP